MAETSTLAREPAGDAVADLKRENAELRAYLKAFCAATIEPEDRDGGVGVHVANPTIGWAFYHVEEDDPRPERFITGGQVRRAMELIGYDRLKIEAPERTIAHELSEVGELRRTLSAMSATVTAPEAGTEERLFWLEAAEQHGFEETEGEELLPLFDPPGYVATQKALIALMAAAREQGRKDVLDALAQGEAARG